MNRKNRIQDIPQYEVGDLRIYKYDNDDNVLVRFYFNDKYEDFFYYNRKTELVRNCTQHWITVDKEFKVHFNLTFAKLFYEKRMEINQELAEKVCKRLFQFKLL